MQCFYLPCFAWSEVISFNCADPFFSKFFFLWKPKYLHFRARFVIALAIRNTAHVWHISIDTGSIQLENYSISQVYNSSYKNRKKHNRKKHKLLVDMLNKLSTRDNLF